MNPSRGLEIVQRCVLIRAVFQDNFSLFPLKHGGLKKAGAKIKRRNHDHTART